ncbi:MAG: SBBP repeat-containing protein [bacterium]
MPFALRARLRQLARALRTASLASVALVAGVPVARAAAPALDWVSRYFDVSYGNNQVTAMTLDAQGNILVTGYSSGSWWDIATVKYAPDGTQLHVARYDGIGHGDDVPQAIAVDGAGNVYVAGYSDTNGQYNYDFLIVKYDPDLVQRWARTYAGQFNIGLDEATGVATDANGNVYVTGFSFEAPTDNDFVTIKYDSLGTQLWVRRYDGPGHQSDGSNAVVLDSDANVYVTGISNGSTSGVNNDAATLKYDTNGNQKWVRRHNGLGNGNDSGISLALDAARDVFVAGYSTGAGTHFDFTTLRYDADGTEAWVRTHDDSTHANDSALDLVLDAQGNVVVTGFSSNPGVGADYTTIKYAPNGTEQWVATYDGPVHGYDEGQAVAVDAAGNVYMTGYSDGGTAGVVNYDYATVKYDPSGVQQWAVRYNGTGDNIDVAAGIAVTPLGQVIVSGWSTGTRSTAVDFATLQYDQGATGAPVLASGRVAGAPRLLGAAPNPFVSTTQIRFELPREAACDLALFDVAGRRVATLARGSLAAGDHVVDVGPALSPGVYFCRLRVNGTTLSQKLVREK